MGKLSRWFADNPRYLRLVGILDMGLGIWLAESGTEHKPHENISATAALLPLSSRPRDHPSVKASDPGSSPLLARTTRYYSFPGWCRPV